MFYLFLKIKLLPLRYKISTSYHNKVFGPKVNSYTPASVGVFCILYTSSNLNNHRYTNL